MFFKCTSLEYIDLSNFDTSKVYTMENMFELLDVYKAIEKKTGEYVAIKILKKNKLSLKKNNLSLKI